MNLAHFDTIGRDGHHAVRVFVGDRIPDRDDRQLAVGMFLASGPKWVMFEPNPGADTVVQWDDGALQILRTDADPPIDQVPPRLGRAAVCMAPPASLPADPLPARVASASTFSRPGNARKKARR